MNPKKIRQHSFHIPKITSLQPLFQSVIETEPTTPIKQGDVRGKQIYLKLEQEKRNQIKEQFLQLKLQKYQNNRKELLYHKLQNLEQKLDKWQQTRKNIEFLKKAKMQYLFEYYDTKQQQQQESRNRSRLTQYRNSSPVDNSLIRNYNMNQSKRQTFFNIQYQKKINEIENRVNVMNKKIRSTSNQLSNSIQILIQDHSK